MTVNPQDNQGQNQEAQKASTDKEHNFALLRKQLEQEKLARQQAEAKAQEAERLVAEKARSRETSDEDDSYDEPYVDQKLLNKKLSKFEKQLEEKIDKKAEEKAAQMIHQQNRQNFLKQNPDFNEVMSPEVLQKFVEKHPDVAEDLMQMPDTFERQRLVYRNIKALGVHQKEQPKQDIQAKIDANRRSPYYQPSGMAGPGYASQGDFSPSGMKNAYSKMQELKNKLRI